MCIRDRANIAFLDQIGVRQTVPQVAARDRNHQTEMRKDQLARRVEIGFVAETGGQAELLLLGQQRKLSGRLDIGINTCLLYTSRCV